MESRAKYGLITNYFDVIALVGVSWNEFNRPLKKALTHNDIVLCIMATRLFFSSVFGILGARLRPSLTHLCPPLRSIFAVCVSRHNGGTAGAPLKPLKVDSALKALSSLRGLRGAPEVPPLYRETQSLGQQMLNATVGINGLIINDLKLIIYDLIYKSSQAVLCYCVMLK